MYKDKFHLKLKNISNLFGKEEKDFKKNLDLDEGSSNLLISNAKSRVEELTKLK